MTGFLFLNGSNDSTTNKKEEPSPVLTPAEELNTFRLSPGLKIQLVAAEPMVEDPVVITFDPDGRLWVVEMRGFMPDINGGGEKDPVGRISVLEDTNSDGQMDVSTLYLDSLVLPRAIALVKGGALVAENDALWLTQDLDGDLKADTKTLVDPAYASGPTPEHSGNGLLRNIDNWYYNAKSRFRYHLVNGKWQRDSTEFRGQWGISNDDEGRLYYNYNWSQLHGDLVPPNYLSRNKHHTPTTGIDRGLTIDRRIYPVRANPAVNRGYIPGTLDREGRLLEFTAACSPLYYRGTALPKEFYGNVFVCEPSGNLIKRNVVAENGLLLTAHDPHPGKEFLASTDERFRPVHLATGPDGALYVTDMYRGLIQHGSYMTPYLREQTLTRKLVQPVHRGRIWKIIPQDRKPANRKKLSSFSREELVNALSHPDAWYRETAQRLLVESGDRTLFKALTGIAQHGASHLGRLHALWTMEGLGLTDANLLLQLLQDRDPRVRTASVRLLEPVAITDKDIRIKFGTALLKIWETAPVQQVLQITLTSNIFEPGVSFQLLSGIALRYDTSALVRDAVLSSLQDREPGFLRALWTAPSWQEPGPGKEILLEMLATSIVRKRDPAELSSLLSMLASNNALDWKEKAVLTGILIQGKNVNIKPVSLKKAPAIVSHADIKKDAATFRTLMAMFEWPGHVADRTRLQTQQTLTDAERKLFVSGRQHYLTTCAGCHGSNGGGISRFAPPLAGSDWVLGDAKRLVLVLLHGLEGPVDVKGKHYDAPDILPVMPAHSTLDDAAIASIVTYIRNEWGNGAGPVSARVVSTTRNTSQGRVMPWTAPELNKHIMETK